MIREDLRDLSMITCPKIANTLLHFTLLHRKPMLQSKKKEYGKNTVHKNIAQNSKSIYSDKIKIDVRNDCK